MEKSLKILYGAIIGVLAGLVVIASLIVINEFFRKPMQSLLPRSGDALTMLNRFTTSTNTSVNCSSVTSTQVIAKSGIRNYALFTNDSANNIYVCFSTTCASSTGARLNANGGVLELKYDNLYIGDISCVAATATSTLNVIYNQTGGNP